MCLVSNSPFKSQLIDKNTSKVGCIAYSVSTFGFMDYQAKNKYALQTMKDPYGCKYTGPTQEGEQKFEKYHIAYLMKRGECPYTQKALNVRKAGGSLAIVYHDDEKQEIDNIIPISPKNMGENVPPVTIISNHDGKKLLKIISETGQDSLKLIVDFEMENTKHKNLDSK